MKNLTGEPHWPDVCRHVRPRDRFLGTVVAGAGTYDVFVYQDNALDATVPDMHLCIRYGVEDSQYISPGNATEFVKRWRESKDIPAEYLEALPLVEKWANRERMS